MGQQPRVSTAVQGLGSETSLGFLMARDQGFSRTINAHAGFNGITATGFYCAIDAHVGLNGITVESKEEEERKRETGPID